MTRYGTQFENLTLAAQTMYGELETNRIEMASTQATIETQQDRIEALHEESKRLLDDVNKRQGIVNATVSNFASAIAVQQSDIKNINSIVRGSLVRKAEKYTFGETNRLMAIEKEDGAVWLVVRLKAQPIPGFVDVIYRNMVEDVDMLTPIKDNIYAMVVTKEAFELSVRPYGLIVKYVADPAASRAIEWQFVATNKIAFDGSLQSFSGEKTYLYPETKNISETINQ